MKLRGEKWNTRLTRAMCEKGEKNRRGEWSKLGKQTCKHKIKGEKKGFAHKGREMGHDVGNWESARWDLIEYVTVVSGSAHRNKSLFSYFPFLSWPHTSPFRSGLKIRNHRTCREWMGARLRFETRTRKKFIPSYVKWKWRFVSVGGSTHNGHILTKNRWIIPHPIRK